MWWVYGQDRLLAQLETSLEQGRPAHGYMLVGPPHVGKTTLALNMAQAVNCVHGPGIPCGSCLQCTRIAGSNHADVRIVSVNRGDASNPERTMIGIDDVKDVLRQVSLKPFEGAYNVVIFESADSMSEQAANALLKTLEEPPPQVLILLLTASEEALLPTIRSRCRPLQLLPMPKDAMVDKLINEHGATPDEADNLSRLSRGCLGWAINALAGGGELLTRREDQLDRLNEVCQSGLETRFGLAGELANLYYRDRDAGKEWLFIWLRWWRDLLLIKEGAEQFIQNSGRTSELRLQASLLSTGQVVDFIKSILRTVEALDRNARPRLALEVLMLALPTAAVPT